MSRVKTMVFALTLALLFPALVCAGEVCANRPSPGADPILALLQPTPGAPQADAPLAVVATPTFAATSCTKEQCSVLRQDCREGCLPCAFTFNCFFSTFGGCTGNCQCRC